MRETLGKPWSLWNSTCSTSSTPRSLPFVFSRHVKPWGFVAHRSSTKVPKPQSLLLLPCKASMYDPKKFTLQVTAEELVLLETALLGLVQVQEHNDALSLLLQRVHTLCPPHFATPPMPSSSICTGSASLSLSPTRFSPDSPGSSSMLASGLPLSVALIKHLLKKRT